MFRLNSVLQLHVTNTNFVTSQEIIECALSERMTVERDNASNSFKNILDHSSLQNGRRLRSKTQLADIIQDIGQFRFLDREFGVPILPRRRRNLAPSKLLLHHSKKSFSNKSSLLFSIVLGKNIPVRNDNSTNSDADNSEAFLGSVVKIQLRGRTYYTRTVKSQYMLTIWNETVTVPLERINEDPGDLPLTLKDESMIVSVFECVDVDVRSHGGFYDDENTNVLSYLHLGSVTIPLSTVFEYGLDGFVRCSSPDHFAGYSRHMSTLLGNTDDESQHRCHPAELMLRIHDTTDPMISIPKKSLPEYPSNESLSLLTRVDQWTELYLKDAHCSILWPDINGVCCLASRFLTELNPPRIRTLTPESCAHYVSLLPNRSSWKALQKLNIDQNLVLSSQQVIDILAGDSKEKSILLANYFLYLSKKRSEYCSEVYLVVGFSIPEGHTVCF
jgi:hypothetical protein